jgi:hypothetical protein
MVYGGAIVYEKPPVVKLLGPAPSDSSKNGLDDIVRQIERGYYGTRTVACF